MKTERIVDNPENHGWELVGGKWIWASGRNTGHITDGDTEGQIATWHDTANAWTPDSAVIVDGGNVGIGNQNTVTPNSQGNSLVIDTGKSDDGMTVVGSNSASIFFADAAEARAGRILYLHSDDSMRFYTNGNNTHLTIDSSGDATFSGDVHIPSQITFQQTSGNAHSIKADTNDLIFTSVTGGKESMRLTYSGDATFSGTARFETWDNPLMLRNGEDVYSIGTELRDITGGSAACVVYDTWQTHYFEQGDPAHTREVIYCDGNATFSGEVFVEGGFIERKAHSGLHFTTNAVWPAKDGSTPTALIDLGSPSYQFKNGHFSGTVSLRSGTAIGTRDLIETLSTLRASTLDESVDVRQALASACDKLIEKFEAMQSEVSTQDIQE